MPYSISGSESASLRPYGASGWLAQPTGKFRPQGLATLSTAFAFRPLGISFNSQRSWASPFRALFLPGDRWDLSNHIVRSGAFLQNLPALHRRFSGLISPRKPCLPHPGYLVRVEAACSHGLSGLSGPLHLPPIRRASLSSNVPLVLSPLLPSRGEAARTPGIYDREASAFPVTGRRPV